MTDQNIDGALKMLRANEFHSFIQLVEWIEQLEADAVTGMVSAADEGLMRQNQGKVQAYRGLIEKLQNI